MAPATPTGLDIAGMGDDFIEWSWDAVSGAEGYEVQISENSQFGDEDPIRDAGTALNYRQGDLDYETRRYLRVRAYIGSGADRLSSEWSGDATSVTEAAPPPPPSPAIPRIKVPATGEEGFVTWSWGAVDGAGGYQIWYSDNDAFTGTDPMEDLDNETLSYTRENLEAGTTHYLRVRSYIKVDGTRYYSEWTSQVSGETDALWPPVPTGLAVDAAATDHNSIGWTWDAVPGANSYEAQFSLTGTFTDTDQIFTRRSTSHAVERLQAEADGYLRVRAVMGTGASATRSDWSEASAGKTTAEPEPDPLGIPANFEASDEERNSISLTWETVDDADHYEVEQRAADGNWTGATCDGGDDTVEDTSCVASGLQSGTDYDFRVRAVPDSGDDDLTVSAWTTVEARTTGSGPATPVTGGTGDLNVMWESTANTITWTWEPMSGAMYQWVIPTTNPDMDAADPCEGVTYGAAEARFSVSTDENLDPGTAKLLCVQASDGESKSFAWGVTAPKTPSGGTPAEDDGVTTSLPWTGIDVVPGFNWELRLAEDQGRNDGSLMVSDAAAVQKACSAGTFVDDGDTDLPLTFNYTWDGNIKHYAGYLLCVNYSNTSGTTAWTVPSAEIYSTPGQPPAPDHESGRTVTTVDSERHEWAMDVRDASDTLPRQHGDYEAKIVTNLAYFADNNNSDRRTRTVAPSVDDCSLSGGTAGDQDQWDFTVSATTANELSGFSIVSGDLDIPENDSENREVRVCVRATKDSGGEDRNGPWRMGGNVTIRKKTS